MLEFSWFVCGILSAVVYSYLFSNLVCNEKFKLTGKIVSVSIVFSIIGILTKSMNSLSVIQPYITHILIFAVLYYIYKKSFLNTLIGVFLIIVIVGLSEMLYGLGLNLLFNINVVELMQNPIIYVISNGLILLISVLVLKIKLIKRIFHNIIVWQNKNEFIIAIVLVLLALTIVMFILYNNFSSMLPNSILWFTNLFCIGVMVFVVGFFKEKSNNNRIVSEYDQLLNYVTKYEKVIDEKSKNQHEYKNQLILIKGMINKTNKKAIQYIDELFKNEKEDDNVELLKKLQNLPQGGLKGLIYYKVEEMVNKGIDVYVDISSELKKVKSKKLLNNNLQDISKILGVYIDNAIEATLVSEQKYIIVESYLEDDNIVFSISNTYKGNVNLNKVDKEGYTTKGEGKGYGLSLVKDIINRSNYLKQERLLNGIYYVQKLYIKK